jgi:hypothetical protein
MRAAHGLIAGLLTLLLCWSTAASAPTASAATDPVTATVGCGYIDLQNIGSDEVLVVYGDPRREREDGFLSLSANASKRIITHRKQFVFLVLDAEMVNLLQVSDVLKPQDCDKVTSKTPKIAGKARLGEVLTVVTKGWGPTDVQLSYQLVPLR